MEKSFLTSVRGAYEPPFAEIIEFAVERGFTLTGDPDGFDDKEGTEIIGQTDVTDPWAN